MSASQTAGSDLGHLVSAAIGDRAVGGLTRAESRHIAQQCARQAKVPIAEARKEVDHQAKEMVLHADCVAVLLLVA